MKITDDSAVYQRAYQHLVERYNIHINPQVLLSVLETVLEDRVTQSHAERRFRQGQQDAADKHDLLLRSTDALLEARELTTKSVAWTGDEGWRDRVTARLDDLLAELQKNT